MSVDAGGVLRHLSALDVVIAARAQAAAREIAEFLAEYAQQNHPWVSRTGETERGTTAEVEVTAEQVRVILGAQTSYAKYLELARSGQWAWLAQAIEANAERIEDTLRRHLGSDAPHTLSGALL